MSSVPGFFEGTSGKVTRRVRFFGARAEFHFNASQNEFLYRALFARRFRLQLAVERVGNVDTRAHAFIVPYLWLKVSSQDEAKDRTSSSPLPSREASSQNDLIREHVKAHEAWFFGGVEMAGNGVADHRFQFVESIG